MLWNGKECGQIVIDQRKLKNVEYFNRFGCLVQYSHMKMNVGFPWKKQDLTRRERFLPANFT